MLMRYVTPSNALWFGDLRLPTEPVRRIPLLIGSRIDWVQVSGAEPINQPIAREVLEFLDLEGLVADEETRNRAVWPGTLRLRSPGALKWISDMGRLSRTEAAGARPGSIEGGTDTSASAIAVAAVRVAGARTPQRAKRSPSRRWGSQASSRTV